MSLFVSDGTVTFYKIGVVSFCYLFSVCQFYSLILNVGAASLLGLWPLMISIFVSVCQYYAIFFASLCTLPFCIFQVLHGVILIWFHS